MPSSLGYGAEKSFTKHLDILLNLLTTGENFAFSRFSDGEIYMLQKKPIIMSANGALVGEKCLPGNYPEDDWKDYNPDRDEFYRQRLEDAIKHQQDNYFKGLSCRCCIADGNKNFQWQIDLIGEGDEQNLSWSNLFINYNYLDFLKKYIPVFSKKKIVFILNKNADIANWSLPFFPVKDFRVGPECITKDYDLISKIKDWIVENNITDHVFLCAASSLSNMIIHQCYSEFPQNTYLDIGSSLNPFIPGIGSRRSYMNQLHTSRREGSPCVW